jgi:CheY-like chemotaxis protein
MAATTNEQVLVIVSDPQAVSVIERVLSSLDVQGVVCKDGDAVRETLKTMTPALLICSESIPGNTQRSTLYGTAEQPAGHPANIAGG